MVTINLAQIYPKLGLHSDMTRLFESAQHLGSQLNDKRLLGLIHSNRAHYYASIGRFNEALEITTYQMVTTPRSITKRDKRLR